MRRTGVKITALAVRKPSFVVLDSDGCRDESGVKTVATWRSGGRRQLWDDPDWWTIEQEQSRAPPPQKKKRQRKIPANSRGNDIEPDLNIYHTSRVLIWRAAAVTDPASLPSPPADVTVVIDVSAAGWRPSGSSATRRKIIATFRKGKQEKKKKKKASWLRRRAGREEKNPSLHRTGVSIAMVRRIVASFILKTLQPVKEKPNARLPETRRQQTSTLRPTSLQTGWNWIPPPVSSRSSAVGLHSFCCCCAWPTLEATVVIWPLINCPRLLNLCFSHAWLAHFSSGQLRRFPA